MMKCSFSRLEVGRSSSMLLPCTVDSPSCSLLVTWDTGEGGGWSRALPLACVCPLPQKAEPWEWPESWLLSTVILLAHAGQTLGQRLAHTAGGALAWCHPLLRTRLLCSLPDSVPHREVPPARAGAAPLTPDEIPSSLRWAAHHSDSQSTHVPSTTITHH